MIEGRAVDEKQAVIEGQVVIEGRAVDEGRVCAWLAMMREMVREGAAAGSGALALVTPWRGTPWRSAWGSENAVTEPRRPMATGPRSRGPISPV